jgi:hypothetical protein
MTQEAIPDDDDRRLTARGVSLNAARYRYLNGCRYLNESRLRRLGLIWNHYESWLQSGGAGQGASASTGCTLPIEILVG